MTVYLDNAATTPPCPEVVAVMSGVLASDYGNPSSLHAPGRQAKRTLEAARAAVAAPLGADPGEIYFTSGGTEANNWAIFGAARKLRRRGRHLILTAIEHDSVEKPAAYLESQGFRVTRLAPDETGGVSLSRLEAALEPDTILVSVMLVNNETGAVLPVREMAALTRAKSGALFHTDAVQGFLKLPISVRNIGADLLTVSAHKLHGPKGVGALWIKKGVTLPPLHFGGGQESGARSGTEPLHNIAGFGAAAELGVAHMAAFSADCVRLQAQIRETLGGAFSSARFLPMGAPHILNLSLPGAKSEVLLNALDAKGVCVSRGSACKKGRRSHVLSAMNLPPAVIDGSLRVSFSRYTTREEAAAFCAALTDAVRTLFPSVK